MKSFLVPIFIPTAGCPTRCVFCEQPRITARPRGIPKPEEVKGILLQAINSKKYRGAENAQVAFYGGTFTRLPLTTMLELLEVVRPFLLNGYFQSVRVSTRPDSLDKERLEVMKHYGVSTVELGAQSLDNRVLKASNRGHSAEDTINAVAELREHGFSVGLQLMPGLPGETDDSFRHTVEQTMALRPDFVRIYPTVVIKGTKLEKMFKSGQYVPLGLERAVSTCADAVERFEMEGIPVVRIGLMSSPTLRKAGQVVAGPWHEAFGDLVRARILWNRLAPMLPDPGRAQRLKLIINPRDAGLFFGHGRKGIKWLEERCKSKVVEVIQEPNTAPGQARVECL